MARNDAIIEAYESGNSCRDVGKKFGLSPSMVHRIVSGSGCVRTREEAQKLRTSLMPPKPQKPISLTAFLRSFGKRWWELAYNGPNGDDYQSTAMIARWLSVDDDPKAVCPGTVWRVIDSYNIPLRSRLEAVVAAGRAGRMGPKKKTR